MCDVVKKEFSALVDRQRLSDKAWHLANQESDSDDSSESSDGLHKPTKKARRQTQIVETLSATGAKFRIEAGVKSFNELIFFEMYNLMCINFKKVLAIHLDDRCVKFIHEWLVPWVQKTETLLSAKARRGEQNQEQERHRTPATPGAFTFRQNPTPNIHDKVWFVPSNSYWKLKLQQVPKKMKPCSVFPVNPDLAGTEYHQEKLHQYLLAVAEWNRCDGSKRHRIKQPGQAIDSGSQASHDSSGEGANQGFPEQGC